MTLNFIDVEDLSKSMKNLVKAPKMKELYLTGNPCESWEGCKEYVIASIPQLNIYNGNEILKSERIKAVQKFEVLEKELITASIENVIKKENDPDKDNPNKYTKEYRRRLYKELEEEKLKKEEDKKKGDKSWGYMEDFSPKQPPVYKDNGELRICNQGKYEFYIDEDIFITGVTTIELKLPKYLDTASIKVDLNPQYIRVDVKGKITQLRFDHEVIVEKSTIQRSTTTGHLLIKAPIIGITPKPKSIEEKPIKENEKSKPEKKVFNLKPLDESLDLKKGTIIEIVSKTESNIMVKEKENNKIDVDISDLPELD
jgi:protein TilB